MDEYFSVSQGTKSTFGQEASEPVELGRVAPASGLYNSPVVLRLGRFLAFPNSLHSDVST